MPFSGHVLITSMSTEAKEYFHMTTGYFTFYKNGLSKTYIFLKVCCYLSFETQRVIIAAVSILKLMHPPCCY